MTPDPGFREAFFSKTQIGATEVRWVEYFRRAVRGGPEVYDHGKKIWLFENRAEFGQIGSTFGNLEKSSDSFESDLSFRYRVIDLNVDPFVSAGFSTSFRKNMKKRPLIIRSSLGFHRRIFPGMIGRIGGRAQRDFLVQKTDLGLVISIEGHYNIGPRGRLKSKTKSFWGFTDRRVVSIENYNAVLFPLIGSLSLSIRQNNFIYQVSQIGGLNISGNAFRSDLTIGFVYGSNWKWLSS